MLDHDAEAFCAISSMIGQMIAVMEYGEAPGGQYLASTFSNLRTHAESLGLPGIVRKIDRLKAHHVSGSATVQTMKPYVTEVYNGLRDDLSERVFVALARDHTKFYRPQVPLFGSEVDTKFPSTTYDIAEAGKCLALDRSTASAFHALRCLEAGIRAVARSLGIPDPTRGADRNWGAALRAIKEEIDRRWPASTGRMSGDARTFDEAYGALSGMQNPFRNTTMHLDDKYTEDEAVHLFELVKGFMVTIATRMDENGMPLA